MVMYYMFLRIYRHCTGRPMMRSFESGLLESGQIDIAKIQLDHKSRDDIPQILKGLQYIYVNLPLREKLFSMLEKHIAPEVSKKTGRPGLELWKILVLGVLRLDLNCDFDRLQELANNHRTIRLMLGHEIMDSFYYHMQTLKDNIGLLTPELLEQINKFIVETGHVLVKKKESEALLGRCDSFVVQTNVHYPTDINLLFDAMRKTIILTERLCVKYEISGWRQSGYTIRLIKRHMRRAQKSKRARGKTEMQREKNKKKVEATHKEYIEIAQLYLNRVLKTLETLKESGIKNTIDMVLIENIDEFVTHAKRQIEQIDRRVLHHETIPHSEKVFSIFEPHTEWISKGKAGVPVELGLRVCILEDQYQFILHHKVMEKQTDDQIAIEIIKEAQKQFPDLKASSFDKGFHSPRNQEVLSELLDSVTLPRKGRLSREAFELENSEGFRKARRKHPAVESAINALEVHGLDRCPDRGLNGFKRYIALAIVSRNIQRIGAIIQQQEQKQAARKKQKYLQLQNKIDKIAA